MLPAPNLAEIEHDHLSETIDQTASGLILIGTQALGGRSTIAHAAARQAAARNGGTIAIVGNSTEQFTHDRTVRQIPVNPIGERAEIDALHRAIQDPDVSTIVYDALPQVGGVAYASLLARSGWLVIVTAADDEIPALVDALVNSQHIACYQGFRDGMALAAEDVTEALVSVTTQRPGLDHHGEPTFTGEHLEFTDEIRAMVVDEQRALLGSVG